MIAESSLDTWRQRFGRNLVRRVLTIWGLMLVALCSLMLVWPLWYLATRFHDAYTGLFLACSVLFIVARSLHSFRRTSRYQRSRRATASIEAAAVPMRVDE
jgi:hypothetical protein